FVDIQEASAQRRAQEYGHANAIVSTDLASVLEQAKPDMVFDCTIPESHIDVTLTPLQHGCHVLGEKPMADSPKNARKMVQPAHDANKLYAVIQNRRYDPNIRRLKQFLESGSLDALTSINSDFYIAPHFGGFRDAMKHVLLLDMAIHTFD